MGTLFAKHKVTRLDMEVLRGALHLAGLESCVNDKDCACVTNKEHENRLKKAAELGILKTPRNKSAK